MADDAISKIFDKLDILGKEVAGMQVKMVEVFSDLKVTMAGITTSEREREKRCDLHIEQINKIEGRVTVLEENKANQDGFAKANKVWLSIMVIICSAIVTGLFNVALLFIKH